MSVKTLHFWDGEEEGTATHIRLHIRDFGRLTSRSVWWRKESAKRERFIYPRSRFLVQTPDSLFEKLIEMAYVQYFGIRRTASSSKQDIKWSAMPFSEEEQRGQTYAHIRQVYKLFDIWPADVWWKRHAAGELIFWKKSGDERQTHILHSTWAFGIYQQMYDGRRKRGKAHKRGLYTHNARSKLLRI
jgi:hypothetical protein